MVKKHKSNTTDTTQQKTISQELHKKFIHNTKATTTTKKRTKKRIIEIRHPTDSHQARDGK